MYSVPWTCSLLAGGSGSFGAERDEADSGEAAMMALPDGGAAGLIAGGVTLAVCEAAGSSGRTGSLESFAFAGGGSEDSAAFAVESAAEVAVGADAGVSFISESFAKDQVKAGEVKLLSVDGVDLWRELGLVYRRDRSLPRSAQALITLIREHKRLSEHSAPV